VNQELDAALVEERRHDLFDQQANQVLLGPGVDGGIRPDGGELLGQREEHRAIRRGGRRRLGGEVREALFKERDTLERRIPALLQDRGDQPVLRLHRIVLPLGPLRFVPGFAEFEFEGERVRAQ